MSGEGSLPAGLGSVWMVDFLANWMINSHIQYTYSMCWWKPNINNIKYRMAKNKMNVYFTINNKIRIIRLDDTQINHCFKLNHILLWLQKKQTVNV